MNRWRDFRRAMSMELILLTVCDCVGDRSAFDPYVGKITRCPCVVTFLKVSC